MLKGSVQGQLLASEKGINFLVDEEGSSCSWRVRIALAYKEIEYERKCVNILKKEQNSQEYLEHNPMGQVPSLYVNGHLLTQSIPIIEYLEEAYPEKPLLPKDLLQRAKVREICEIIASGIQPIQNNAVIMKYSGDDEVKRQQWAAFWISKGFNALEKVLAKSSGKYCVGDTVTMADCCLVPQVYNALRFKVDMSPYPIINRINSTLEVLEPFKVSHASVQPDTPPNI